MKVATGWLFTFCSLIISVPITAWGQLQIVDVATFAGTNGTQVNNAIAFLNNTSNPQVVLYFRPGTYNIDVAPTAITRAGVWVRGDGANSILKRGVSGGPILNISSGLTNVKISDLAFDMNLVADNTTAISAVNANRLRVEDCRFYSSVTYNNTAAHEHAVWAPGATSAWITRNRLEACQVTMSNTTAGGPGVFVRDNYFTDTRAHAVQIRSVGAVTTAACTVSGNIIINPAGVVILFGREADGDASNGKCNDIQIVENQIIGTWIDNTIGIKGVPMDESNGWIVANNILHNEGAIGSNTKGILLYTTGTQMMGDLTISGNTLRNLEKWGIEIGGGVKGLRIIGNHVNFTDGIFFNGRSVSARALIMGNTCVGNNGIGMYVWANGGDLTTKIIGNEIRNTLGSTTYGLKLEAAASRTLNADVFANEFSDDQTTATQDYGVFHTGTGTIAARYYDNRFSGNTTAPVLPTSPNPPTGSVKRDNAGW